MKPTLVCLDKQSIKDELIASKFVRRTNKADNEIYVINAHNSPHVMQEIGRLRELAFRSAGGGSGNDIDVDRFDFLPNPYEQIIVWNPDDEEIIGGYRFLHGRHAAFLQDGQPDMPIGHLFTFSELFIEKYLPITIELGRAFVQPKYQSTQMGVKSLYALDNLWDGIGALLADSGDAKYLIGKVTIFPKMAEAARYAIIYFLKLFFPDPDNLFSPIYNVHVPQHYVKEFDALFSSTSYRENFLHLNHYVKQCGENIPTLIRAYIELSSGMRTFGTCLDESFGHIFDTGMMITIENIYQAKRERYIDTYVQTLASNRLAPL
ncbi:MAG: GNAT family N-acetyltransferase [Prevotellaceae bacterium]|jgi:hypothetical protein|nr:GNAT family N-acetyltransferase [Prevotellaceae bacterium]